MEMAKEKRKRTKSLGARRDIVARVTEALSLSLLLFVVFNMVILFCAYPTRGEVLAALVSGDEVKVTQADYGWVFDGEGTRDLMVFMGGARVEELAYAPLARELAAAGIDVCIVNTPIHFALLDVDAPARPIRDLVGAKGQGYDRVIVGGHSLGGLVAGWYASEHPDEITDLVMLGSYTTKDIDESISCLLVAGTNDRVLNWGSYERGKGYLPDGYREVLIEGGNHAQFASYGSQFGDGAATITRSEQVRQTVRAVRSLVGE